MLPSVPNDSFHSINSILPSVPSDAPHVGDADEQPAEPPGSHIASGSVVTAADPPPASVPGTFPGGVVKMETDPLIHYEHTNQFAALNPDMTPAEGRQADEVSSFYQHPLWPQPTPLQMGMPSGDFAVASGVPPAVTLGAVGGAAPTEDVLLMTFPDAQKFAGKKPKRRAKRQEDTRLNETRFEGGKRVQPYRLSKEDAEKSIHKVLEHTKKKKKPHSPES